MSRSVTVERSSSTPIPVPPRCERWQSPTGRYLERGQTFKVRGNPHTFKFLAYVESAEPHVEAVEIDTRGFKTIIRCIRPEAIARTSKKVAR